MNPLLEHHFHQSKKENPSSLENFQIQSLLGISTNTWRAKLRIVKKKTNLTKKMTDTVRKEETHKEKK